MIQRILVIDDDVFTRLIIARTFTRLGYAVVETSTAMDVPDLVREGDLGCVFLGLDLPDADGMILLSALKQSHPALPIVLVTSHLTDKISLEAHTRGALCCLQKPISSRTLERLLAAVPRQTETAVYGIGHDL